MHDIGKVMFVFDIFTYLLEKNWTRPKMPRTESKSNIIMVT